MLGLFPENGSGMLIWAYFFCVFLAYTFVLSTLGLVGSMMADVVDEGALKTNLREEGLYFSSLSFAAKCTVGLGYFIAGLLLKWISFPQQVDTSLITVDAIEGLGIVGGLVLMTIYLSSIVFIYFYPISKERFHEISEELRSLRS
jgi:GPH family glycoside/pentoside/hexuronide:cation symporter